MLESKSWRAFQTPRNSKPGDLKQPQHCSADDCFNLKCNTSCGVVSPFAPAVRMLAKVKEVVTGLNEINNKIDAAYSAGVVDGFSKQPCPKYSIFFLGVFQQNGMLINKSPPAGKV